MTYTAFLCYPNPYPGDDNGYTPVIKFTEPERYMYSKIIPISFNVLHEWSSKDEKLYD